MKIKRFEEILAQKKIKVEEQQEKRMKARIEAEEQDTEYKRLIADRATVLAQMQALKARADEMHTKADEAREKSDKGREDANECDDKIEVLEVCLGHLL